MDVSTIVLEYVCPTMGAIIANVMFSAPVKSVQEANKRGRLGDLNPTPWAFMLGNCLGWVSYSFLIKNYFVFFANAPGLLMSVWLNLSAAKLQFQSFRELQTRKSFVSLLQRRQSEQGNALENRQWSLVLLNDKSDSIPHQVVAAQAAEEGLEKQEQPASREHSNNTSSQLDNDDDTETATATAAAAAAAAVTTNDNDWAHFEWSTFSNMLLQVTTQEMVAPAPHEKVVLTIVIVWLMLLSVLAFFVSSLDTSQVVVGLANNVNLLFFYGAPLSTIVTVLRQRNSASIHIGTMITNTANGAFWAAYGISIVDLFIAIPNSIGVALGVVQIVLCLVFPRHSFLSSRTENDHDQTKMETLVMGGVETAQHSRDCKDENDSMDKSKKLRNDDLFAEEEEEEQEEES